MAIRYPLIVLILSAASWTSAWGQTYIISTYAGNGVSGYLGDGSTVASAEFSSPEAVAIDASGNIYIADTNNNRIRKVDTSGNLTTYAGNGTAGYLGDAAAATAAELNKPSGLVIDSSGNLYIADSANHVIRMVNSAGTITTYAGNNIAGYQGDNGVATGAELNTPTSVALDTLGNLYIADSKNGLIRKVTSTGTISTLLGSGATNGRLNNPISVAVDASNNFYIADNGNKRILKYAGGILTTLAGDGNPGFSGDNGPSTAAELNNPAGVAVDSSGNLYIADCNNSRVRVITPAGIITTIAGNGFFNYYGDGGPATSAALNFPRGVTVDSKGNIYVSDSNNHAIRLLQPVFPVISDSGVTNAASYVPQISPGALASVFGMNFAQSALSASVPFPTALGSVSVTVNGRAAPITYVSPQQVNFQVPWETSTGTATVAVSVNGGAGKSVTVPVTTAGPGIFVYGSGQAIAANSDFTLNAPGNPAAAGSTIVVYLTGSGPLDNPVATGAVTPSSPLSRVTSSFSATIGSAAAQVSFLGLAPTFFGVVQANIVVPSGLASGDYPLVVTINGEHSNSATISVK